MDAKRPFSPPTRADARRAGLFVLALGVPSAGGVACGEPLLGAFVALGGLFALTIDPRARAASRTVAVLGGALLVVGCAALGLLFAGHRWAALSALLLASFLAGQPRPEHAYLSLLGKYAASALVLAELGFPATAALGVAYLAGALFALVLALAAGFEQATASPLREIGAVLGGDTNGPLYGMTLPLTILLGTLSAQVLHFVEPGWVALTILFVMHVDDALAWRRIRERVIGTLAGVVLAWLQLVFLPGVWPLLASIVLLSAAYPYALRVDYLAFSAVVTALVLLLIDVARLPGGDLGLVGWRLWATLLGCGWVAAALVLMHALRRFIPRWR
ncbi:FUSC family protein [Crenobacter caeni]|uniref:FUSC family protein n=1 Tax=Crenobacter caeni TaxID=2705474 RepID=A0A6B2KQW4_9NEIS|nr:FUSC family protein [Crenobacter caeni]NDV12441.1 FUSC family protein [Crenobacter caeni]